MKTCTECRVEKDLSDFYQRKNKNGQYILRESACKICTAKKHRQRVSGWSTEKKELNYQNQRKWEKNNAERHKRNVRKSDLKNKYGITIEYFENLLLEQDYLCKICNKEETSKTRILSVDHCHVTGKVRGLLCSFCNTGIGLFKDSIKNLEGAIKYLEESK